MTEKEARLLERLRLLEAENAGIRALLEARPGPSISQDTAPKTKRRDAARRNAILDGKASFQNTVIEEMIDAVIACDANGVVQICNRAAREWHAFFAAGKTLDEWGAHYTLYNPDTGDLIPREARPLARALRGDPVHHESYAIDVDGHSRRHITVTATPLYDSQSALQGAVALWADDSDRQNAIEKLRINRDRLRAAQRIARVGSFEYDIATGRLWGSDEAERVLGRPAGGPTIPIEAFLSHVREREVVEQALHDLITSGKPLDIEITLAPEDNSAPRILAVVAEVVTGAGGEPARVVGVVRDLTDEKHATAGMKKIGQRLRLALDAAEASPFEWDLRTGEILSTERRRSLLGIDPTTFDGRYSTFLGSVHENDVAGLETALSDAKDGHIDCKHEIRVLWPDGTVHWLEIRGRFEYGANQLATRMVGVVLDVTERRQAEEDQERLAAIVECTSNAIIGVDLNGAVSTWNPAAERISGLSYADVRGKRLIDMISPASEESIRHILDALWRGESVGPVEMHALLRGREAMDLSFTAVPIRTRGRIVGGAALVRDVTESRRTQKRLDTQISHLNALRSIDTAILGSIDTRITLDAVVSAAVAVAGVDAASILVMDRDVHDLRYVAGSGFKSAGMSGARLHLGEGWAGISAARRRPVVAPPKPIEEDTPSHIHIMTEEAFNGYAAFPLIAKGDVKGVLEVFSYGDFGAYPDTLEFLESLAGQAAIAVDNAALFEDLQRSNMELVLAYDATIEGWSRALDLRDAATHGHSERVADLTIRLARCLPIPGEQIEHLRRGALLHDIGKMAIPDEILLKPDRLSEEEISIMRRHAEYAYEMLSPIEFLRQAIDIPYCHHERWDGSGYPRGLKGAQIPLAARIFAVADVWDALCSDRPYRAAWPRDEALRYIRQRAGIDFDPAVVEAFLKLVQ